MPNVGVHVQYTQLGLGVVAVMDRSLWTGRCDNSDQLMSSNRPASRSLHCEFADLEHLNCHRCFEPYC